MAASVNKNGLTLEEVAALSDPATGEGTYGVRDDGKPVFRYSGGSEVDLSGGGGAATLAELTDVASATQTANFVMAAGDGATGGTYRGRALVLADLPGTIQTSDVYTLNEASNYTTTSTTWVDIDGTNLALTITPTGTRVFLWFDCNVKNTSAGTPTVYFDIEQDDGVTQARIGGDDGLQFAIVTSTDGGSDQYSPVAFNRMVTGLTPGTAYTFSLQWKTVGSGGVTLYAGAGTTNLDMHPQFGVFEIR